MLKLGQPYGCQEFDKAHLPNKRISASEAELDGPGDQHPVKGQELLSLPRCRGLGA